MLRELARANDFACGFQSSRSSGTRSSSLRVIVISWSNSGSRVSTNGIRVSAYDGLLPKLTFGTRSASGGALNSGCSLKPKMPAVTFDGNDRRDVL